MFSLHNAEATKVPAGDEENGLEDTGRDEVSEWHGHIYTTKRKIDS